MDFHVNTWPPFVKNDDDSSAGLASFWLSRKPNFLITSISRWRVGIHLRWFICRQRWEGHGGCGPTKQFPKSFYPTRQPIVLRMNQRAVCFLDHLSYVRLLWISIPNQSINTVTILYPIAAAFSLAISPTPGKLTSQGFARLIVCCIWRDGSTRI